MTQQKKILIVDDSPVTQRLMHAYLKESKFEILLANDGYHGLKQVKADPEIKVILCDLNMPNLNGIEMIKKIRSQGFHDINVFMLTSESPIEYIKISKELGIKGWIIKPFKRVAADALIKYLHEKA